MVIDLSALPMSLSLRSALSVIVSLGTISKIDQGIYSTKTFMISAVLKNEMLQVPWVIIERLPLSFL